MAHEKAETSYWIELLNPIHWQLFATVSYPTRVEDSRIIDRDVLLLKRFIAKTAKTIVLHFWVSKHQHGLTHIHVLFAARDFLPFYSLLSPAFSALPSLYSGEFRRLAHIWRSYPRDIRPVHDRHRVVRYLSDRNTSRLYSSSGSFSSFALSFDDFNHSSLKQLRRYGAREPYDPHAELQRITGELAQRYRRRNANL